MTPQRNVTNGTCSNKIRGPIPFFAFISKNSEIAIYYILFFPIWSNPYPFPIVSLKQLGDSILYSWGGEKMIFFSLFLYFFYKKVNYSSNLNLIVIQCLNTQRFLRVYIRFVCWWGGTRIWTGEKGFAVPRLTTRPCRQNDTQ